MRVRYATVADLASFDEIVDVRTPAEFALDHIPGALNAPVLSNEERIVIGTMYRTDPFGATRLGASLVANNIATHLQTTFVDRPATWKPVIYCWRGGKRSGSMSTWFNLIGWRAQPLAGGYKSYRRWVVEQVERLPTELNWVVLRGLTGCGKTRLLAALEDAGAQVLDLESLALHRGSLLGAWPSAPQPSQKGFDSATVEQLAQFKPDRPVFIEAESRSIGSIRLPLTLSAAIETSRYIEIVAPHAARIEFLCAEYQHLFDDPDFFKAQLDRLVMLHGRAVTKRWHELIDARDAVTLFAELIDIHYDPAYRRSLRTGGAPLAQVNVNPGLELRTVAEDLIKAVSQAG